MKEKPPLTQRLGAQALQTDLPGFNLDCDT